MKSSALPVDIGKYLAGQRVLVTGHTGFKGGWLSAILMRLGASVYGISLEAQHERSSYQCAQALGFAGDIRCDIRDRSKLENLVGEISPNFVFHLAAQPLVSVSYMEPIQTWNTNVIGTMNVLNAVWSSHASIPVVVVTSDKCYENVEWEWGYRENDQLGGKDPYSLSKAAAEFAVRAMRCSYPEAMVATVRAGNVVGGGDWSSRRLIPDIARAANNNKVVTLNSPLATRPWQFVVEPLWGYLLVMDALRSKRLSEFEFNFGPSSDNNVSVLDVVGSFQESYRSVGVELKIDSAAATFYEANLLALDSSRSTKALGWRSIYDISRTIESTFDWYWCESTQDLTKCGKLMVDQIDAYLDNI